VRFYFFRMNMTAFLRWVRTIGAGIAFFVLGVLFEEPVKDKFYSLTTIYQSIIKPTEYEGYTQAKELFSSAYQKYLDREESAIDDFEAAIDLFKTSYIGGINGAAYNLALMYMGVEDLFERNSEECKVWMLRAISRGNPKANIVLCIT